jgi:hypothetical protein
LTSRSPLPRFCSDLTTKRCTRARRPAGTYRLLIATATAVYLDIIAIATDI